MFSFEELSVVKKGRRSLKKSAALNCVIKGTYYFIINPFFLVTLFLLQKIVY